MNERSSNGRIINTCMAFFLSGFPEMRYSRKIITNLIHKSQIHNPSDTCCIEERLERAVLGHHGQLDPYCETSYGLRPFLRKGFVEQGPKRRRRAIAAEG